MCVTKWQFQRDKRRCAYCRCTLLWIPVNTIPKATFLPHSHHRVRNRSQQQWWVSWWMIGYFWKSWSCFTLSGWCCSTTQGSSRDSWRQSPCAASPWYQLQLQMPKIRKFTRYPYFLFFVYIVNSNYCTFNVYYLLTPSEHNRSNGRIIVHVIQGPEKWL